MDHKNNLLNIIAAILLLTAFGSTTLSKPGKPLQLENACSGKPFCELSGGRCLNEIYQNNIGTPYGAYASSNGFPRLFSGPIIPQIFLGVEQMRKKYDCNSPEIKQFEHNLISMTLLYLRSQKFKTKRTNSNLYL